MSRNPKGRSEEPEDPGSKKKDHLPGAINDDWEETVEVTNSNRWKTSPFPYCVAIDGQLDEERCVTGLKTPVYQGSALGEGSQQEFGEQRSDSEGCEGILGKKVLEETSVRGFTSRLFVIEQGEKTRPVIDCKALNRYMKPKHFKMENLETLASVVRQGDYLVKIDLKDAYLHVPIHEHYRKYLQLSVAGKRYQFRALPFGLT